LTHFQVFRGPFSRCRKVPFHDAVSNYAGVLTDLREKDVRPLLERGRSFARVIWRLYDAKAGLETQFKDGLSDLGLHHPPKSRFRAMIRLRRKADVCTRCGADGIAAEWYPTNVVIGTVVR
jgi:hypothetical protein